MRAFSATAIHQSKASDCQQARIFASSSCAIVSSAPHSLSFSSVIDSAGGEGHLLSPSGMVVEDFVNVEGKGTPLRMGTAPVFCYSEELYRAEIFTTR